jgi:hypothetical protein
MCVCAKDVLETQAILKKVYSNQSLTEEEHAVLKKVNLDYDQVKLAFPVKKENVSS